MKYHVLDQDYFPVKTYLTFNEALAEANRVWPGCEIELKGQRIHYVYDDRGNRLGVIQDASLGE